MSANWLDDLQTHWKKSVINQVDYCAKVTHLRAGEREYSNLSRLIILEPNLASI